MKTPIVFHEDVFYEYFRPFRHPSAHFEIGVPMASKPLAKIFRLSKTTHEILSGQS